MEEQLKKLKTSLDKTVYKNICFEQSMQDKTIEKLKSRTKRKNYTPIFASIVAITVAIILFLSFDLSPVNKNLTSIGNKVKTEDLLKKQSVNYLIVTKVEEETPSILLLNVNKNTKDIRYTTIANNVFVENKSYKNLITAEEFESAFGVKITRVFEIDPNALGSFIEKNNGIEVKNSFEFEHGENVFNEGLVRINHEKELINFITMRKNDPRGYYGRNIRIMSVYEELLKNEKFLLEILQIKEITAFDEVLLSSNQIEETKNILFEPQIIDRVLSETISKDDLEVFRQTFGD